MPKPNISPPLDREAKRRLAVIRHVEEVTGIVAMSCRYFRQLREFRRGRSVVRLPGVGAPSGWGTGIRAMCTCSLGRRFAAAVG